MKKVLVALVFLVSVLSACANSSEKSLPLEASEGIEKAEDTFTFLMSEAEKVEISEDFVTFTDDSGRAEALKIKKNPKKTAVLYGSLGALWIESGGRVSVGVGGDFATELYEEQLGRDITKDEGFVEVAQSSAATTWDVEKILAEYPDLIICSTAMKGYQTISEPAKQMQIPVIALDYNGIRDYLKWFKVFTAINDSENLFEETATDVARKVSEIIDKVPKDKKVRALSLLPNAKAVKANLLNSNIGEMLSDLKAVNVADSFGKELNASRVEVNIEQIYQANPEVILIQVQQSEAFVKKFLDESLASNPVWNELSAVKSGRVHFLPKKLFHNRPNKEYADAYKMLFELLYPEVEL